LIKALSRYEGTKIVLIAPDSLRLPDYIKHDVCEKNGIEYREVSTLEEVMGELDILYMTRVQQERFTDKAEYERVKDCYILDTEKMALAKENMAVLHPLPRVNEITKQVDADPRAAYFRQVENGKFVRMALIYTLLKWAEEGAEPLHNHDAAEVESLVCPNKKCICNNEPVDYKFQLSEGGVYRCLYCSTKAE
jgi:aspartate carbamoyltransferase catalytic subunit